MCSTYLSWWNWAEDSTSMLFFAYDVSFVSLSFLTGWWGQPCALVLWTHDACLCFQMSSDYCLGESTVLGKWISIIHKVRRSIFGRRRYSGNQLSCEIPTSLSLLIKEMFHQAKSYLRRPSDPDTWPAYRPLGLWHGKPNKREHVAVELYKWGSLSSSSWCYSHLLC